MVDKFEAGKYYVFTGNKQPFEAWYQAMDAWLDGKPRKCISTYLSSNTIAIFDGIKNGLWGYSKYMHLFDEYNPAEPSKMVEMSYVKKLSNDHWGYVEDVLFKIFEITTIKELSKDQIVELIEFHYKSAFEHGFKHGVEYMEGK